MAAAPGPWGRCTRRSCRNKPPHRDPTMKRPPSQDQRPLFLRPGLLGPVRDRRRRGVLRCRHRSLRSGRGARLCVRDVVRPSLRDRAPLRSTIRAHRVGVVRGVTRGQLGTRKGAWRRNLQDDPRERPTGSVCSGSTGRARFSTSVVRAPNPRAQGAHRAGQDIVTSLGVLRAAAREVGRWLPVGVTAARCSSASTVSSRACEDRPVAVARPSLVGL